MTQPDDPFGGGSDLAPKDGPQANLSLRKIQDMLKDENTTKLLEDRGWSREQIDQFTKAFEKPNAAPAGPGRKIDVGAGKDEPAAAPSANLPGFEPSTQISTRTLRGRNSGAEDDLTGMHEGQRSEPPAEFRSLLRGYKSRIARSPVTAKRPAAPVPAKP